MIQTKPYTGTIEICDGKIIKIDLSLPDEKLSDIRQIMALKHCLENYIKEFERDNLRRL